MSLAITLGFERKNGYSNNVDAMKKMISQLRSVWIIPFLALWVGCGGSALPQSSIPAPQLTIEGSVESPSSASSNISAGLLTTNSHAITDTAAGGVICRLFTLEGELLAVIVTTADGSFSVDVNQNNLKGSDDTGTTWSEGIVLECANGIQLYSLVTVVEESTSQLDIGTANMETLLAILALTNEITGFTTWSGNYVDVIGDLDLSCIDLAQKSLWSNVDLTGQGLADEEAIIKEALAGFIAGNGNPLEIGSGYADIKQLLQAAMSSQLTQEEWNSICSVASSVNTDLDVTLCQNSYSSAFEIFDAISNVFSNQFSTTGIGSTPPASVNSLESSEGSVCDSIKNGDLNADTLVNPILAADDLAAFNQTFGDDEGGAVLIGLAQQCLQDNTCDTMVDQPTSIFGFLDGYGGDLSNIYNPETGLDNSALQGIGLAAKSCHGETGLAMKKCAKAMYGTIFHGGNGFDDFKENGQFKEDKFKAFGGYWAGHIPDDGFDPDDVGDKDTFYQKLKEEFENNLDDDGFDLIQQCINDLLAQGIFDTSPCFAGFKDPDSFDGCNGCGDGEVAAQCGDGVCDATETSATCVADCPLGDDQPPPQEGLYAGQYTVSATQGPDLCMSWVGTSVFFAYNDFLNRYLSSLPTPQGESVPIQFQVNSDGTCNAKLGSEICDLCALQESGNAFLIQLDCDIFVYNDPQSCQMDLIKI